MSAISALLQAIAVPAWPGCSREVLVLRFEETPTERAVVDGWIERVAPRDVVVEHRSGPDLAHSAVPISSGEDVMVLPVRVAWATPGRGERGVRESLTHVAAIVNAHVGLSRAQPRILRETPELCRLVVGKPALISELRARFERNTSGEGSFGSFVGRQAVLALERAERTVIEDQYKVPQMVPEEIRTSRSFDEGVSALADQIGRSAEEIMAQGVAYLHEMAAAHSRLAIDLFARFGRFLLRAYGVEVDTERLQELRELNRDHTLVFLPNHRSYLDPFVVRSTLLAHGFPANHCFAGNNMAWWPMGDWTRRTGNIILRRSIGDDAVYKLVLREYLGYLMRKRLNIEWYIEGGRTRTGKLRPPRYGLLTYLVEAFEQLEDDRDVYLVPVSLVYDGLPEVWALTAEQQGAAKKPESVAWLLSYPRSTGRGFGSVHLGLGEPLSLRSALGAEAGETRRRRVEKVAFEVCHRINRVTPVTPTALVTLALLGVDDHALTRDEIRTLMAPMIEYFERRGLPVTGDLGRSGELGRILDWLSDRGVLVRFDGGLEPVWGISPDRHVEAAFYRNSVLHFVLDRAIVELVLAAASEGRITVEEHAWAEALRLRDLLKFEFFFPEKDEYRENLKAELSRIDPEWEQHLAEPDGAALILARARPHFAHRTLHSFLEAYFVTAGRLAARLPSQPIDETELVSECLGVARQRRMQHQLRSSDAISTEVLRTFLRLAAHRGLMGPGGAGLAERRRAFAAELAELVGRLDTMRDLAMTDPVRALVDPRAGVASLDDPVTA
jgi:glycerol-3-phosphate O-acyltransferase